MKKFYDIEIDSQVELENGKTLGKLEESKISVNDGNCGSGGGAFVIDIDNDDWENMRNDPDFGLTVWKAFQSGQQIQIHSGEIPYIKCDVVSNVRIGRACGPTYLMLYYITDFVDYKPEDADDWYVVPYMNSITLLIDVDSIAY